MGPPRTLVLDASGRGALVALVGDGVLLDARSTDAERGVAAALPALAADLLDGVERPALVACVVGPGSFTGIRAALALAHGLGLALPAPVVGVTVGEALRAEDCGVRDAVPGRPVWTVTAARRGMVFLDRDDVEGGPPRDPVLLEVAGLPSPDGPVAVMGDAAEQVAAALAAQGSDVVLLHRRRPGPLGIAAAAVLRQARSLRPRPAQPLYAEAPMARAAPPRPPPAGALPDARGA